MSEQVTKVPEGNAQAEEVKKEVNPVVTTCLLLTAKVNKNGDKIGVALLDHSGKLPNGHYDVLGNDNPVITSWLPMDERIAPLLNMPVFAEIGCLVAGNGDYKRLVKVLTGEERTLLMSLMK